MVQSIFIRVGEGEEAVTAIPYSYCHGGVLIVVKDISCQELDNLHSNCESKWVKISLSSKKNAYIAPFYNPKSSLEAFLCIS